MRVKKNCSFFLDYLYFSTLILNLLLLCGYEFNFLMKVLNTVDRIDRKTLIPYKNKNENIFLKNDVLILKLPYDLNIYHDKTSFQKIKNFFNETYRYDLKIKFFYSTQSNLSSLILHNFRFPQIKLLKNKVCFKSNCET